MIEAPPFARDRRTHAWLGLLALSQAGDVLWLIGLTWTAVQLATPAAAGLVVAAGTIPRALMLLYGGVVADRFDGRRIMLGTNSARVMVLLVVVATAVTDRITLGVLVFAAIGFGLTDAIHEPASATIGRQLVRPDDFAAYSGVGQTLFRLGSMAGNAIGGVLVAVAGIGGSAGVNAVTFALLIGFIALLLRPRYPIERAAPEPPLRAIRHGFAHLRDEPVTRTLVLTLSGLNLFVGPALGIGLALRAKDQGWGAQSLGVILAMVGVGGVVGSVALVRWRPARMAVFAFALLAVQGLAIVSLGWGNVLIVGLAAAVIGVTAGAASALLSAVFTEVVDGAYFGRMVSIQRLGDDVIMPLATAGFGVLSAVASLPVAFTVYGVAMALMQVVPLTRPTIRSLRSSTPRREPSPVPQG